MIILLSLKSSCNNLVSYTIEPYYRYITTEQVIKFNKRICDKDFRYDFSYIPNGLYEVYIYLHILDFDGFENVDFIIGFVKPDEVNKLFAKKKFDRSMFYKSANFTQIKAPASSKNEMFFVYKGQSEYQFLIFNSHVNSPIEILPDSFMNIKTL